MSPQATHTNVAWKSELQDLKNCVKMNDPDFAKKT